MNSRTRLVLGSLVGAVAIHLALLACGGPRRDDDGGALDAIADIASAETGEASAQDTGGGGTTLEAMCVAGAAGTSWAFFDRPGLRIDVAPRISAIACRLPMTQPVPAGFDRATSCTAAGFLIANDRIAVGCAGAEVARIRID